MSAQAVGTAHGGLVRSRRLEVALGRRRLLLLAYAFAILPSLLMAFVQPVWQLTDEAQHYDVIAQYAHGVYPVEGRTTLRPETAAIMRQTGIYRWSPAETQPAPLTADAALFTPAPSYLSGYAYTLWIRRHIWWFSYEAMQPPLYYVAALPVWMAADHVGGTFAAVSAERVFNCLLLALLAPLALLTAWSLAPTRPRLAWAAAVLVATLPGLLLNGSQVTNDALGAVLGSATLLLAARWAGAPWTYRRAALLGLLFGLTLLTKLTAFGIVGGLALAWAWPAWRDPGLLLRQLRTGLIGGLVAVLVASPWLAANLLTQHELVPTRAAARLLGAGTSAGRYNIGQDLHYAFTTFWTGEHQWSLPLSGVEIAVLLPFLIAAAVGLLRLLRQSVPALGPRPVLLVLLAGVAGQAAWALAIPYVGGLGGMTPGRYLYPAVVPAIVLIVAGASAVFRRPPVRLALVAGFALLTVANVAGYTAGYTAVRHVDREGPPAWAGTRDVSGQGSYQGVTIQVDRIIDDPSSRWVWLHLNVANATSQPVDWWPGPAVDIEDGNGWRVRGDFAASTPFPETLPPSSHFSGWVKMLVTPAQIADRKLLFLDFEDVAANGYRAVGYIPIALEIR